MCLVRKWGEWRNGLKLVQTGLRLTRVQIQCGMPYQGASWLGRYGQSDFFLSDAIAAWYWASVKNIPPKSFQLLMA